MKHSVSPEDAPKFVDWLNNRGGIAVWKSIDLSDLGKSWSTPARTEEGGPYPKPSWQAESSPSRIITDPAEIDVVKDREVKRFHVALRMGAQGIKIKLTDTSSRRVRKEVERAGVGAFFKFDYGMQECVIFAPETTIPLPEWINQRNRK